MEDEETGDLMDEGHSLSGHRMVALFCREPVAEHFDPLAWERAYSDLREQIG